MITIPLLILLDKNKEMSADVCLYLKTGINFLNKKNLNNITVLHELIYPIFYADLNIDINKYVTLGGLVTIRKYQSLFKDIMFNRLNFTAIGNIYYELYKKETVLDVNIKRNIIYNYILETE